jgi:hypothetical protein
MRRREGVFGHGVAQDRPGWQEPVPLEYSISWLTTDPGDLVVDFLRRIQH